VPEILPILKYADSLTSQAQTDLKLLLSPTGAIRHTELPPAAQSVMVLIGPEGGFDPEEIRLATEAGIQPITLGKRILRTETAGFTTIAWLMYQLEN
jgi:16S rRNA (uracil1498-N3)-methyltransferase